MLYFCFISGNYAPKGVGEQMWSACGGDTGVFPGGRRGTEALLSSSGLYPPGDLWPTQPVCVTSGFNCALENTVPGVMQGPAPVHSRYRSLG